MPKVTIVLSYQAERKLRLYNRKKGDLSRTIEDLIMNKLPDPP